MIRYDHWFLPDGETHLQDWMQRTHKKVEGRLTYQYHKYEGALKHCTQRRVAVDIGAHVGLWSYWMAKDFQALHAFEPKAEHVACWQANMQGRGTDVTLHPVALGHHDGQVGLYTGPSSSGDTRVVLGETGYPMATLDSFGLTDVDFMKIDCEGFEVFILEGARETVRRCHPIIIVEQKPGHGEQFGRGQLDAVRLLEREGYICCYEYAGDYAMRFDGVREAAHGSR